MTAAQPQAANLTHASILAECRALILDRLSTGLTQVLEDVDAELQARRNAAGASPEGQIFVEAQFYLRAAAPNLERSLRRAFEQQFRSRATPAMQAAANSYENIQLDLRQLSLVDDDKMSEHLRLQQSSRRLQRGVASQLEELQPRVALLLGQERIEDGQDPLGPDSLCAAVKEVCWDLAGSDEVRNVMLEQLVGRLASEMPPIYDAVNHHLEDRGIEARRSFRRAASRASAPGHPAETPAPAAKPEAPADEAPPAAPPGGSADLASLVQQLLARVTPAPGGNAPAIPAGTPAASGAAPAGGLPPLVQGSAQPAAGGQASGAGVHLSSGEVVSLLTQLQHGESARVDADLQLSLDEVSPTSNVLHHLLQGGLAGRLEAVDNIIIDVVATLFDHIFEDLRVPELMKGLIGRLQIPVLKLAMLDRGFLSSRIHPARRLINTLAHAASTWDGGFTADTPLYQLAEKLIHRIQLEFFEDPAIFAAALEELEAFLARQDAIADARTLKMTSELERIEREEIARHVAQAHVATLLADEDLPAALGEFVRTEWTRVLAHAAARDGEDSPAWQQAAGVLDQLLWSIQPKIGSEDRQRLVGMLPDLLGALREGMEQVETPADEREVFFAELVKLHAAAVKAGLASHHRKAAPAAETVPQEVPAEDSALPALDAEEIEAATSIDPFEAQIDGLARGCWLTLQDAGEAPHHLRLTWVSPARTMYLFANRQGLRALAMTRAELREGLENGRLAATDDEAFIDRIVDHVFESYQGPAQA